MANPDYFTVVEFRALPEMDDATAYPEARILAAASYFTAIVEREVSTSFVSRAVTAEIHDGGTDALILRKPYVLSVTSATENGITVTDTLQVTRGIVRRFAVGSYLPKTFACGSGNVAVTYAAGYSTTPPADVKDAVMWATRDRLLGQSDQAGVDVRRTSVTTDFGTTNYVLPGEKRPTGFPELDAVIAGWQRSIEPLGFA